MEELQSTEILDREILEEARKKASRILKNCEESIRIQNDQWEQELNKAVSELDEKYRGQKEAAEKNIMARLPVDKLRLKIEKIEELLKLAVRSWFDSLSRERILELITLELSKRLLFCKDQLSENEEINVQAQGLEQSEAQSVINSINKTFSLRGELRLLDVANCSQPDLSSFPSIALETNDICITASVEEAVNFLLQEKRAELVEALIGRSFMDGK